MQRTWSKITFWAYLSAVTNVEIPETNSSFLACEAWCTGYQNGFSYYNCNRWLNSGLCYPWSQLFEVEKLVVLASMAEIELGSFGLES